MQGQIKFGQGINIDQAPYLVSIQRGSQHIAGGVILSCDKILTAAHVFDGQNSTLFSVLAGSTNQAFNLDPDAQVISFTYRNNQRNIDDVEFHPDYGTLGPHNGDLAIITLPNPLSFNSKVQPIDYARPANFDPSTIQVGDEIFFAGWGETEEGSVSNKLQSTNANIIQNAVANSLLNNFSCEGGFPNIYAGLLDENAISVRDPMNNTRGAQGDSGGPGVLNRNFGLNPILVGSISGGSCGDGDVTVFVDIYDYADWIEDALLNSDCCNLGNLVDERIESNTTWNGLDRQLGYLRVEENVTLTIKNSTIQFNPGGWIYLDEHAELILEDCQLTSNMECNNNEMWKGIYCFENNLVRVTRSVLRDAEIGIETTTQPGTAQILLQEASIVDCEVGIIYNRNKIRGTKPLSSIKNESQFVQCNKGIVLNGIQNIEIENSSFIDNDEALVATDSYIQFGDNLGFFGSGEELPRLGMYLGGTFPLASSFDVGSMDYNAYDFSGLDVAVLLAGATHPEGVNLINCDIEVNRGIINYGTNKYTIQNNTFNTDFTFAASYNSGFFSKFQCNLTNHSDNGIHYIYDNAQSTFLENEFVSQGTDVLVTAGRISNIGDQEFASENCFDDRSHDIIVESPPVSTPLFRYFYYEGLGSMPCNRPNDQIEFRLNESLQSGDYCADIIGIFGLIDPDDDGEAGIADKIWATHIDCNELRANILQSIQNVSNIGSNTTIGSTPLVDPWYQDSIVGQSIELKIMQEWLNYGILRSLSDDNFNCIDDILDGLNSWHWQKINIGYALLRDDINKAESLVNGIASNFPDQIAFKETQQINLKRLKMEMGIETDTVTEADIAMIRTHALAYLPSSGYALSLFSILTGEVLDVSWDPSNIGGFESILNTVEQNSALDNLIYPNPVTDELRIRLSPEEISSVIVYNITGNQVLERKNTNRVDVTSLPSGPYFLYIGTPDDERISVKFIKK